MQTISSSGIYFLEGLSFDPKRGIVGWREQYEKHLDSEYWLRVRRAVRRRATGRDGKVRCQRCGSEEGPFDCHHTTEGYRFLGEELDHLDLLRYWCRACHEFRHGHGRDPMVPMSWEELEERIRRL
jgi:hypothetical protein